jgi:hypothetical protein
VINLGCNPSLVYLSACFNNSPVNNTELVVPSEYQVKTTQKYKKAKIGRKSINFQALIAFNSVLHYLF